MSFIEENIICHDEWAVLPEKLRLEMLRQRIAFDLPPKIKTSSDFRNEVFEELYTIIREKMNGFVCFQLGIGSNTTVSQTLHLMFEFKKDIITFKSELVHLKLIWDYTAA